MQKTEKHWYQSKTVWFNLAVAIIAITEQLIPVFQNDEQAMKILVAIAALGNLVLRFTTSKTIVK